MKNNFTKLLSFILCLCFVFGSFTFVGATETEQSKITGAAITPDTGDWEITDNDIECAPITPSYLVVIKVNFDANGNGKDDFDIDDPKKLYSDKNSPLYGEQWCQSADDIWAERFFSNNGKSLCDYYDEISGGRFTWISVEETSGTVNDGIITVTLNRPHPAAVAQKNGNASYTTYDGGAAAEAVRAAAEFVDFSKYDTNGNKTFDLGELSVLFIFGGVEIASGRKTPKFWFETHGHCANLSATVDGIKFRKYTRVGEWQRSAFISIGTVAHELIHSLGYYDLYDTDNNGSNSNWSNVGTYSIMASGSHTGVDGDKPTHLDPWQKIQLGFAKEIVIGDGEHTVYAFNQDEYAILRVNTPDPKEYFLIENRQKVGFDFHVSSPGIVIWHIDEDIINIYERSNQINAMNGHDLGIAPLFNGGNAWAALYGKEVVFNSQNFSGKYSGSPSLNSFVNIEDKDWNLEITIKSESGVAMEIEVAGAVTTMPPVVDETLEERDHESLTISGIIKTANGQTINGCGIILSKDNEKPTVENGTLVELKPDEKGYFTAKFSGLEERTKYYYTIYVEGENFETVYMHGYEMTEVYTPPKTTFNVSFNMNGGTTVNGGRIFDQEGIKFGEKVEKPTVEVVKNGYEFKGYFADKNCTIPFNFDVAPDTEEDIVIYLGWEKIEETTTSTPATETTTNTDANETTTADTTTEDSGNSGKDGNSVAIIAIVVGVILLGGMAVAVVIVRKKK